MKIKFTLTKQFIISSLVAFAVIGFSLNYILAYEIKRESIENTKNDLSSHIADHATIYIPIEAFTKPDLLKNKSLFEEFLKAIDYTHYEEVKIYDSNGTIIYSDSLELVGQNYENHELDEALEGVAVAEVIKESHPKGEHEKHQLDTKNYRFMEIYIPIKYEGNEKTVGIVELYVEISSTFSSLSKIQQTLWLTTTSLFTLLFITLYWIFKKASETIFEKNRALAATSKSLKTEQEQDEAIMESMGEGLIVVNKDGQILLYNPKVEAVTGFSSQEVEFRHYKNFVDLRDKNGKKLKEDYIKTSLKQGLVVRKTYREDIYIKNKKGKLIPISLAIAPIFSKDTKIRGLVFNIHDARTEKELDKVKDEFVYVVAHELGNPIFTVDGYLTMALDGSLGRVNKKIKTSLESAKAVNKQLSILVSDLLEVIKSESGKMQIELEKVDMVPIIKEVIKSLSIKAKEKKIKLQYEDHKIPKIMGNKDKLREVFTNLIDNAIKYSPEKRNITITSSKSKDHVTTHIADEGFGMTRGEKEHLFEKFYRIKNEDTKHVAGTGLGLFIVKNIIEKMNGEIWVESSKDKGSTFSFSLKIAKK